MQAQVLLWYGFPMRTALWDSIISNATLMSIALLVSVILQHYLPQKHRYSFLLGLCTMLTVLWFLISRSLVLLLTGH